jgi:hypothetical protein
VGKPCNIRIKLLTKATMQHGALEECAILRIRAAQEQQYQSGQQAVAQQLERE